MRSMTGFGRGEAEAAAARISVEVRTVNHKGLDVRARLPRELAGLEPEVQRRTRAALSRGRVTVHVELHRGSAAPSVSFDAARAAPLLRELRAFAAAEGLAPPTLHDLLAALTHLVQAIAARAGGASDRLRRQLESRLQELQPPVDETRLAQEVAILAERADVTEELDRLGAHLKHCAALLDSGAAVGRKLDFLCQELNREANTVASKCQDAETAHLVVELKANIERLREQVQNAE